MAPHDAAMMPVYFTPILSLSAPSTSLNTTPPTMMMDTAMAPALAPSAPCAANAGICWKKAAHMTKMQATRMSR